VEGFYIANQTNADTIEAIAEAVARLSAPFASGGGGSGTGVESGALVALGDLVEALGALVEALGALVEAVGALVPALGALVSALGALVSALGALVSALGALVSALGDFVVFRFLLTCDCSLARTVAMSAKSSTMMEVDFILFLFRCLDSKSAVNCQVSFL
jgi:hypothetical protein